MEYFFSVWRKRLLRLLFFLQVMIIFDETYFLIILKYVDHKFRSQKVHHRELHLWEYIHPKRNLFLQKYKILSKKSQEEKNLCIKITWMNRILFQFNISYQSAKLIGIQKILWINAIRIYMMDLRVICINWWNTWNKWHLLECSMHFSADACKKIRAKKISAKKIIATVAIKMNLSVFHANYNFTSIRWEI